VSAAALDQIFDQPRAGHTVADHNEPLFNHRVFEFAPPKP
jgi:hypothetical protein